MLKFLSEETGDAQEPALEKLVGDFVDKLYKSGQFNVDDVDFWISKKLEDLEAYHRESVEVASLDGIPPNALNEV